MKDLIIIGSSGAGVSAAIYAVRRGLNFTLIGKEFGGEILLSGEIENYPGFAHTTGEELTAKLREHLQSYNVEPVGAFVEEVNPSTSSGPGREFRVVGKTTKGEPWEQEARAVIVATGQHARTLDVPGEKEYKNRGVSYCTVCDGPLFKGKKVVIVGGGNTANEAGIMMNGIAESVTVLTKNEDMKGDKVLMEKLKAGERVVVVPNASTTEILGNDTAVTGLRYTDSVSGEKVELPADGVFVHIGWIPNTDMVADVVERDGYDQITIDRLGRTSLQGLFAAGDCTDIPYKQIAVATGQGVTAALSVVDYLNKLEE